MDAAARSGSPAGPSEGRTIIKLQGSRVPLHLLVASEDPSKVPKGFLSTPAQQQRAERDAKWGETRDKVIALTAAGLHIAMFAYNLAFWGSEGMPEDRYWPAEPRVRLRLQPGRYGNVDGTKRVYFDYMARNEGLPLNN